MSVRSSKPKSATKTRTRSNRYRLVIRNARGRVVEERDTAFKSFAPFHRAVREMTVDHPNQKLELVENGRVHTVFTVNKDGSYTFERVADAQRKSA